MIDRDLRSATLGSGPRLIARNALAARQWEASFLAAASNRRASTPALYSYRAWLADRWRSTLATDDSRALLTRLQSAALWRTVIEASPEAGRLLDSRHAARWAAQAHRLLADWRLSVIDVENADASRETRVFLAWQRSYLARLGEFGWLDESSLPGELPLFALPEELVLLDLHSPTKAESVLFATLRSRGWQVESKAAPRVDCIARQVALHDSNDELERAAEWASARLAARPDSRIALVVPDLANEPALVLQRVRRAFGPASIGYAGGVAAAALPAIGAALSAIELATGRATFATLSRWLRSPFFQGIDGPAQSDAAAAEAALRNDLRAQLPFLKAYEEAGLAERLAALVPSLAERLRAGLGELRAPRPAATPDVWARAWSRGLTRLGWPAQGSGVDATSLDAWDQALAAFAALTPIVGPCAQETAIEELRATADAPLAGPLPLNGLHVLARADDVGPGYSGVWVTGVTDRNWPEPARLNPLLPAGLQIKNALPWSTPADSLARARATFARLFARTGEVVLSWPRLVQDYRSLPSPLLAGIATAGAPDLDEPRALAAQSQRRALESIPDPAPAFTAMRIPGGANTLDSQARCPVRAFCETRLKARALLSPEQGLSPGARGIVTHRALELLSTRATAPSVRRTSEDIAASVERALAETFGPARRAFAALVVLEAKRLEDVLARFVEAELARPPFRTVAVEQKTDVRVEAFAIACRFDRLDELADGSLALIDYKSGASRTKSRWLDGRLASVQLPLYALQIGPRLSALLTLELGGKMVAYRGVARRPDRLADTLRAVPDSAAWMALLERWRTQIHALVEEYVGGDVRVYAEDWSDAAAEYAPLTRVYAHAALRQPDAIHEE